MHSPAGSRNHAPNSEWGIVGGGVLGMTIALRLAQRGCRVTLLEARPHPGGLADAWQLGDLVWDRHYHVTLMSDASARGLLRELSLDDQMVWVNTKTGFFTDHRLHSMSDTIEFLRFPPLRLIDKLRLGYTIFHASRVTNWQALEQIPVADWLRKFSGRRTFEKIWLPLLRAKLGDSWQDTSAAFIWATIARMYAARRSGLKKEMFGYVPGGYATIMQRLAEKLTDAGVQIICSAPVRRIETGAEGTLTVHTSEHTFRFRRVVSTLPAVAAPILCEQLREEEKRRFSGVRYHGIVCASVLLQNSLSPFYVTNITDAGFPFTAVIEMSSLVKREHLNGHALVYLPRYVRPDDPVFERSDAALEGEFLEGLRRMHPRLRMSDVKACRISRVRHVFALPTLGYSASLPPIVTSVPGFFAVSSAHIVNGTLNVNESIRLADQFVEQHATVPQPEAGSVSATSVVLQSVRQP